MSKIKNSTVLSLLIPLSMLCFAIRGKVGAIIITVLNFILLFYLIKEKKIHKPFSNFYAAFILVFSLVLGVIRSSTFEYYLFIGYFTVFLVLLNNNIDIYKNIWNLLGKIAIFEAFGIFIQKLLPNIYYSCISMILPSSVVMSIKDRLVNGYYTGFTREISFTMFFIVIGLGIYIFDILKKDENINELNYKIKKYLIITFLFIALLISGKRATLLFFILSIFIIQFIKSKNSLKIIKYLIVGSGIIFILYITFSIWSKISYLSRIVELINYINTENIVGITNGRNIIYQNAIDLWNNNRIFGIGWGNFKYMVSQSLWYSGYDVHNCYLQILCENGLIGAIIFYILTVISSTRMIKCVKKYRDFGDNKSYKLVLLVSFIQIFFIIYSITEPILYEYTDYIIYFISINIIEILLFKIKHIKKNNI